MKRTPILTRGLQLAFCLALAPMTAHAAYPDHPLRLVIPFPAGGATDVLGRLVAMHLGERLGQTIVVENKPGAGTSIGASFVAKSKPDGYTLLVSSGTTFTVNPAIYKNLPYDPATAFDPIGQIGSTGLILVANPAAPANDLAQFVALAKPEPGKLFYGSFGTGTTAHFAAEMLASAAGIKLTHAPYKGSAPAMTDLIGNQISYSFDTVAAALPQIKAGTIKPIVSTAPKRSALLPNVPTAAESGYPNVQMDTWLALVAPKGLPENVKVALQKALAEAVADPAMQKKMIDNGFEPDYATGTMVAARIQRELPLMKDLATKANIQAD